MIRVRKAGLLTTVQDLGRPGLAHLGVPTAGAADRRAFGLANRLVGNRRDAAGLEITLAGPELELEAGGWVALTGGRVAAEAGGRPLPMDMAVRVEPGQVLRVGSVSSGLRAYLAVRGGIDVPAVLGSRSTDTLAPVGPPRLEEGTLLPVGDQVDGDPYPQVAPTPAVDPEPVLRIVRGPRDDVFTDDALRALIGVAWTVTSDSDRTGVRLDGPELERRHKVELAS
ncbi:MAG TPA: biotin-dependent carboxyltransferase family protein, partial [Actinomycetes bacterium]|nr:biotin-dependent carboxyltransferase family protein [Actinomycetes bacterium]